MPRRWSNDSRREYDNAWYAGKPETWKQARRDQAAERRRQIRKEIWRYKAEHPCACGEGHPAALDFHHEGGKEICVAVAITNGWSIKRLMTEIAKCIVICANCHRKHHLNALSFNWQDNGL